MNVLELLKGQSKYNQWAHSKLLYLIRSLSVEQQHTNIPSSFNSLYKTIFHVWGAELLWYKRLIKQPASLTGDPFEGSMGKLSGAPEETDQRLAEWFHDKRDEDLTENLHYTNLAGNSFDQPFDILLLHIFNHSTYHNGQLVTMLRALGIDQIPATDLVVWARETL